MEEPKIPENQDIQENVIKSPENPVKPRPTKRNFGGGYHFCIVPNCGQTVSNGVSMYTFPNKTKATLLHKSWINILKLKQKPGISAVVCSLHFSEDSFKPSSYII